MLDMVNRGHVSAKTGDARKAWRWMIIDSIIIGGIAMVAAMGNEPPGWADVWVMFKGFLGAFLLQLAVERGLKRERG